MMQKGTSLVEIVVVIAVIGFLVILVSSLPNSINLITKAKNVSIAREVIEKEMEDQRSYAYINLASGPVNDNRLKLLPEGSSEVLIEDCDPNICTKGENTKGVTITVSWKESGKAQSVKVKTFISEGGLNK